MTLHVIVLERTVLQEALITLSEETIGDKPVTVLDVNYHLISNKSKTADLVKACTNDVMAHIRSLDIPS